ncbi:helix-turn-helix domain-containing protein [Streptomyces sp. bgisy022]|uniref:helix-turn-helix domain-containing protein n=1 Tax=Streptomyces sp. bgisy022 TaxID=3413769 RepID=UPI003D70EA14
MAGQDETSRAGGPAREAELLTEQLRLLRRRHGMTLATLANRTSYSKSSWGRYLSGKALPPRQAVHEFARAVGVKPDRLLLMLEIAERAQPDVRSPEATGSEQADGPGGAVERTRDEAPAPEDAGPAEPAERVVADAPPSTGTTGTSPAAPAPVPAAAQADPEPAADRTGTQEPQRPAPRAAGRRPRRWSLLLGAATGVGMVTGLLGGMLISPPVSQSEPQTKGTVVRCTGFECRGKDAQRMECHIGVWTAAAERVDGLYLELRYSPRCGAAWARITEGEVGDTARVEGKEKLSAARSISYDRDTYSPMIEAPYPAAVRACVVPADGGAEVCTPHGGPSPLPAAVTDERKP